MNNTFYQETNLSHSLLPLLSQTTRLCWTNHTNLYQNTPQSPPLHLKQHNRMTPLRLTITGDLPKGQALQEYLVSTLEVFTVLHWFLLESGVNQFWLRDRPKLAIPFQRILDGMHTGIGILLECLLECWNGMATGIDWNGLWWVFFPFHWANNNLQPN